MSDTDHIYLDIEKPSPAIPLGDDHPEWSQKGRWPLAWCILSWIILAPLGWGIFYVMFRGGLQMLVWSGHGIAAFANQADLFFVLHGF